MNITGFKPSLAVIALLVFIPLVESLSGYTLWGLNWFSPKLMEIIGFSLYPIKIISIVVGLLLLRQFKSKLCGDSVVMSRSKLISSIVFSLGIIQIVALAIGLFWNALFIHSLDYRHKEKNLLTYIIYVYTFDPGAIGRAYHHVYLKCPRPFGRYELIKLGKFDWVRNIDFDVKDRDLLIYSRGAKEEAFKTIALDQPYQC